MQRDFYRTITSIGTPGVSPKPRGFLTGRVEGYSKEKRKQYPVVKKAKKIKKSQSSTRTTV